MLINQDNMPVVAMDFMNDLHLEDIAIINELYNLIIKYENKKTKENKHLINMKYMQWFNHTVNHFKKEEEQMIEKGFPPYPMHKNEHENALNIMNKIFKIWEEAEDINTLKNYIKNELPNWLINHIKTMDTVTAMFFKSGFSPCAVH